MLYKFTELTKEEYTNFEKNSSVGTFLQSSEQAELLQKRGYKIWLLGVKADNKVVAAALVMREKVHLGYIFSIDRGPMLDFNNHELLAFFMSNFVKFSRENKGLYIEIRPNVTLKITNNHGETIGEENTSFIEEMKSLGFTHLPFVDGFTTAGSPEWEYIKDLSELTDEKSVRASYNKKAQYYLKKNAQFGIQLRQLSRKDLPEFKELTQKTANRLHYKDKNLNFYQTVYDVYGDNATFIFAELNFDKYINEETEKIAQLDEKLAKINQKIEKYPANDKFKRQYAEFADQKKQHNKRILKAAQQKKDAGKATVVVAGALFLQQPQEMNYLYSGTYEEYMDYYGPYQIQDVMINEAVKQGLKRYNFYGIAGKFDGSDGVLGFKTTFEGHARQLVGNFMMPVNPIKYKFYRLLKKMLGRA
ncbi:methicillin resistance factor FemB [Leuconostoc litchii]|uniref:Aminoacyltransferase FemA n=1 Tax=Leuconostoc litchii TaxID=1981069 RepID=A0A6P2CS08_9LACO|nr:aminoacyltransferase [Leuconostoc litchii]TYC47571.1 aminoacyltransferase [Leuconostoc litchii]GMA69608.1 methicillin resistance factor FemB [Leuconostoc litchii]